MKELLQIIVSSIGFFVILINGDPCPSPCWCIDQNTTVVCNLTALTQIPKHLPRNAKTVLLRSNQINMISKADLEGLSMLQTIDFTRNKLISNSIETGAFNISSLTFLDLSDNLFEGIPTELPPYLTTLNFLSNPIKELKADSFTKNSTIQYLNLLANELETIDDNAFDSLSNVKEIDLSSNKLTDSSFRRGVFKSTKKLEKLRLNYNQLQNIPDTSMYPNSLKTLEIYGNVIKQIKPLSFSNLANLTTLAVAQGHLTTIEDRAFIGLVNLKTIDLSQGHISSRITNGTFSGLDNLVSLTLDINNISNIEPTAFHSLENIIEIGLSENKLQHLDSNVFNDTAMPLLSEIYLYGNPWYCDCNLRWLKEKMDKSPNHRIGPPSLTTCTGPPNLSGKSWKELTPSDFKC